MCIGGGTFPSAVALDLGVLGCPFSALAQEEGVVHGPKDATQKRGPDEKLVT